MASDYLYSASIRHGWYVQPILGEITESMRNDN